MSMTDASASRRLLLALLLVLLGVFCLLIVRPFITSILWAAILAYASWPLLLRLRRILRGLNTLAALLMTLILGCAVVLPVLWILVLVQRELIGAYDFLTQYLSQGSHPLPGFLRSIPWVGQKMQDSLDRYAADPTVLARELSAWMLGWASELGTLLGGVGRNVIRLTLTLLTLFFFFKDGDTIVRQSHQVIKGFFDDRLDSYIVTAGKMTRAVVYGLLITAITQGLIAGIGYWIVGLSAPVLLGALTGILSIVPLIGTAIVWVPTALWLLSTGLVLKGIILLVWGALLVHPADNVLRPILISSATRVPFLLVMFGALGGLEAFGLVGLFIGPVLLAIAMAIWREWSVRPDADSV